MNNFGRFTALVCCSLAAASLFADITTGWIQTGAGTYDYNDTANWANGVINGVFSSDLTLTAEQTITFSADTQLPDGLSIAQTGAFAITFASDDASAPRTLTLGGGYTNNGAGDVVFDASVVLDLGGDTRTLTSAKKLTLSCVVQNGGVVFDGAGAVVVNGANTYAGGTTLNGSGTVYQANTSAFGTGRFTFGEGSKLCARVSSFATAVPITLAGSFTWTTDQKKNQNMGNGDITILKPLTASIESGYTLTLGGQVAADSPCDITAITKAGNGSLGSPSTIVLSNGEEKTLNVSGGNFYFSGTITGEGTFVKAGGGYLELSGDSNPFEGTFVIKAGSVRHKYQRSLPSNAKFLILGNGVLRSNTSQDGGYRTAASLLPLVDTASTGILGISSNESGDMDLTNYPYLRIAPNGDTFEYSGNIIAPSTGVLRIGGGGKTLKLSGTITGASEIDASTGSIQFNASQPDFDGTVICGPGYTLTVGSSVELANADLVSDGGTIRFASATAGEFVRARSVTLKTAQLTVDSPSAGATTHKITGILLADVNNKTAGGIPRVTLTNSGANGLVLSAGSVSNALDAAMLHVVNSVTGEGTARFVIENTQTLGLVGNGAANSVNAPVAPFVRVDNSLATYTSEDGLRALNSSEYTVYEAGYEGPVRNAGENLATTGNGTVTLTGSATVNAIWMMGATGADQTLKASEGSTITVASGAIQINTYGSAKYELPTDFGTRRGFICARSATAYNLSGSLAGTGGLTIADGSTKLESNGVNLYSEVNTYSGDTWIFSRVVPKKSSVFPHAEQLAGETIRLGDVYLYGKLYLSYVSLNICGLNGVGDIEAGGSDNLTLTLGFGDANGDHSGLVGSSKTGASGNNFTFAKVGAGWQRLAGTLGGKSTAVISGGGVLQIDGVSTIGSRDTSKHIVFDGGTLSGSGTISDSVYCGDIQIKATGVIAPGSKENPNVPLKLCKNVEMTQGASMKFYIGADRASQAIVAEGYGITGTATTIPVTVDCTVKKKGSWLLLEADTFNDNVFVFTTRPSGGRLVVKTDETTNREQLWYEQASGLYVAIR